MKICPKCNADNNNNSTYCKICGSRLLPKGYVPDTQRPKLMKEKRSWMKFVIGVAGVIVVALAVIAFTMLLKSCGTSPKGENSESPQTVSDAAETETTRAVSETESSAGGTADGKMEDASQGGAESGYEEKTKTDPPSTEKGVSPSDEQSAREMRAIGYESEGEYVINRYNSAGKYDRRAWYTQTGLLRYIYEYQYDERGNLVKAIRYNRGGSENGRLEFQCGEDGRAVKSTRYDDENQVSYVREHYYDEAGYLSDLKRFSLAGVLLQETLFEDGIETERSEYNELGDCENVYIGELDAKGDRIREIHKDGDGNIVDWYSSSYDDDHCRTSIRWYRGEDTLWYQIDYIPNLQHCKQATLTVFDGGGNITDSVTMEDASKLPIPE